MPRKYKLKFGGGNSGNVPVITDDTGGNKYLLIGLVVVCFIIPLIASSIYFAIRNTCSSKIPTITCDTINGFKIKDGMFDSACGENCNIDTCCESKVCKPASSRGPEYLGTMVKKKYKNSDLPQPLPGITCNAALGYSGQVIAQNCGGSDEWHYEGCGKDCVHGQNNIPAPPGGRISISSCGEIDLSINTDGNQEIECNKFYSNQNDTPKLCILSSTGLSFESNECTDDSRCHVIP